jgi:hypothetical protein
VVVQDPVGWASFGAVAFALFLVANPLGLPPIPSHSEKAGARTDTSVDVESTSVPTLTVVLPQFPVEGTNNLSLDANWGPAPSGCLLRPGWSSWFLPSRAAASGIFASPNDARTEFVPENLSSAVSEVGVRSDAQLSCGNSIRTLESVAFSNVTTYATLTLTDLAADPSATAAPGRVQLGGFVAGGRAPYDLGIAWGDGSFTNQTLPTAGPFLVPHTFESGTFQPRVGVYDSDRIDVRGGLPEPVDVSNATVLAINASLPLAEVGVPVEFRGTYERPIDHFGAVIGCTPDPFLHPQQYLMNISCTPSAGGVLGVTFKVGAPVPQLVAQETREEPVAPPVDLVVRPVSPSLDAGVQTYVRVTVVGGVPPFDITWASANGTLGTRSDAPADGSFLVPWTPPFAGASSLNGSVTDSLGVSASSARVKLIVNAPPTLLLQVNRTIDPSNTTIEVVSTLVGGSSPLSWGLRVDPTPATEANPLGESSNGSFDWWATFLEEGVATIEVAAEDAASDLVTSNLTVELPLPPTLTATSSSSNSTGTPQITLTLTTTDGVLPFSIWINSTGASLWNGSETAGGPYLETVSPVPAGGSVDLSVALVDARGTRVSVNVTTTMPAPPVVVPVPLQSSPSNSPPSAVWMAVVGIAVVAIAGGGLWAFWRRRSRPEEMPAPDAATVLERLLRPADGADRLTIELMAEEEGVPLETVQGTLDRLIREGRVRSESDPGGGEVLAWSDA